MIQLSKPTLLDIEEMQLLVIEDVKSGVILPRTNDEMATTIRSYVIAKDDNKIVGYTALHLHSVRLAEIRSLIVDKNYRGKDIGKKMVQFGLDEAYELGVGEDVLALTYVPDFFKKLGFVEIEKSQIPEHKIWADCIKCIHFPVCNEVAVVFKINKRNTI